MDQKYEETSCSALLEAERWKVCGYGTIFKDFLLSRGQSSKKLSNLTAFYKTPEKQVYFHMNTSKL